MKTNYTKDKWIMNVTEEVIAKNPKHLIIESKEGVQICKVNFGEQGVAIPEYIANAALISNAPEILSELNNSNIMLKELLENTDNSYETKISIEKQICWNNHTIDKATT